MRAGVVGAALAVGVLLAGTYAGGGLDGPCLGGDWVASFPDRGHHARWSSWPPGIRCTVISDGAVLGERVYPAPWVWAAALLAGLAPAAWQLRRP